MPIININGKDIDLPQNTIEQIKEALSEKKEVWQKEIDNYYFILSNGYIEEEEFFNSRSDKSHFTIGNCFQTKQEAQEVVDKLKAIQRVKEYIAENDIEMVEIIDEGFRIYFSLTEKNFDWVSYYSALYFSPFGKWFKTEKGVEQVIKNCEQDLKIIWGIK